MFEQSGKGVCHCTSQDVAFVIRILHSKRQLLGCHGNIVDACFICIECCEYLGMYTAQEHKRLYLL